MEGKMEKVVQEDTSFDAAAPRRTFIPAASRSRIRRDALWDTRPISPSQGYLSDPGEAF